MAFYIKNEMIQRLNKDGKLRIRLAAALEVSDRAVYDVVKKSQKKPIANSTFTKKAALDFFKMEGYEEDSFLTNEIPVIKP
ncbi:hypothetical protein [Chryseobacterium sp.]|uniref:hypothetical protein n=1 Tax=Chryseobacterium sp. TaxID=1871047 RepID=UPI0026321DF5|nr:hypothetical protein [Chryseobacterium sp.]